MKTIVLLLNRTSARVSINHIKVYKERITRKKKTTTATYMKTLYTEKS